MEKDSVTDIRRGLAQYINALLGLNEAASNDTEVIDPILVILTGALGRLQDIKNASGYEASKVVARPSQWTITFLDDLFWDIVKKYQCEETLDITGITLYIEVLRDPRVAALAKPPTLQSCEDKMKNEKKKRSKPPATTKKTAKSLPKKRKRLMIDEDDVSTEKSPPIKAIEKMMRLAINEDDVATAYRVVAVGAGLENLGGTSCFLNVILQCLTNGSICAGALLSTS